MFNLHAIVNPIISILHPNSRITLYRSIGQVTTNGETKATYAAGISLEAQIQSESTEALNHANMVNLEEITRRVYLPSQAGASDRVSGIVRPVSRNGDLFQVDAGDAWYPGQWFLILGPIEDFSHAGWQCFRATMQVTPPDFSFSDWAQP